MTRRDPRSWRLDNFEFRVPSRVVRVSISSRSSFKSGCSSFELRKQKKSLYKFFIKFNKRGGLPLGSEINVLSQFSQHQYASVTLEVLSDSKSSAVACSTQLFVLFLDLNNSLLT